MAEPKRPGHVVQYRWRIFFFNLTRSSLYVGYAIFHDLVKHSQHNGIFLDSIRTYWYVCTYYRLY